MFSATLSVPAQVLSSTLALITVLRYAFQTAVGPALTNFIATQRDIHYAHLTWQLGFNLLSGMPSGQTVTQAQAANASIHKLMSQGFGLGMNDAAGLLLLIVVLGTALAVLLLLMGRPAPADRAA